MWGLLHASRASSCVKRQFRAGLQMMSWCTTLALQILLPMTILGCVVCESPQLHCTLSCIPLYSCMSFITGSAIHCAFHATMQSVRHKVMHACMLASVQGPMSSLNTFTQSVRAVLELTS